MENLDFKKIRSICAELEENIGVYNWREVVEKLLDDNKDFEVAGYRFISLDSIDKIQQQELESDEYVLGCFNAWFLTSHLEMSEDCIKAIQEKAPDALGQLIISKGVLPDIQRDYAEADGYGHHFAHYDHEEVETSFGYSAFRVQ